MTGIIDDFRSTLLGIGDPPLGALAVSAAIVAVLVSTGPLYFRRMERAWDDRPKRA